MIVAINTITCEPDYRERFEDLFRTRAGAIDRMPGFHRMHVLRPHDDDDRYLIVSEWDSREAFDQWTNSPEFIEGHKRGFADIRKAKDEGRTAPMSSQFQTYEVISA